MTEPRFLAVRLGSLGDIVHTFPAVAALRESFPQAKIVWLTHPRWKFLVESSGLASEVCTVESRSLPSVGEAVRQIQRRGWDAAIDYQGLWKSALLPLLGGVRQRIGFSSHTIREFGVPAIYTDPVRVTRTHIAEQNGELSQRAGSHNITASVHLRIPPEDEAAVRAHLQAAGIERYVVLSPGGGWRSKCWPAERFGALSRKIRDAWGLRCVVNFGPGEDDLAAAVRAASGGAEPLFYNAPVGPLTALLQNARCIVGGDTGPLHLAVALGAPAVALYGPTDPARNGPFRSCQTSRLNCANDIVLRTAGAGTSHKRHDETDPSMLAIQVDSVFEAVRGCLGAAS
jgi:lipopolysaccharide heptosyltransferase I